LIKLGLDFFGLLDLGDQSVCDGNFSEPFATRRVIGYAKASVLFVLFSEEGGFVVAKGFAYAFFEGFLRWVVCLDHGSVGLIVEDEVVEAKA
jgi:hypothetical protein